MRFKPRGYMHALRIEAQTLNVFLNHASRQHMCKREDCVWKGDCAMTTVDGIESNWQQRCWWQCWGWLAYKMEEEDLSWVEVVRSVCLDGKNQILRAGHSIFLRWGELCNVWGAHLVWALELCISKHFWSRKPWGVPSIV